MSLELFDNMQKVGVNPSSTTGNNLLKSLSKGGNMEQLSKVFEFPFDLRRGLRISSKSIVLISSRRLFASTAKS